MKSSFTHVPNPCREKKNNPVWRDACFCVCALQESRDKGTEVWKISKVQFVYDTSETSHFINAYNREFPASNSSYSARLPHRTAPHRFRNLHSVESRLWISYRCDARTASRFLSAWFWREAADLISHLPPIKQIWSLKRFFKNVDSIYYHNFLSLCWGMFQSFLA